MPGVQDAIGNFNSEISARYNITFVTDPMKNPLYKVTNDPSIEKELLRCPDNLTNSTQLKPLLNFSSQPFYQLKCFDDSFALGRTSTRSPYVPVSPRQRKVNQVSPSQSTASSQSDSTSSSGTEQVSRKRKSFASIAVPTDDAASRAARLTQRSARKLQSDFY